FANGLTEDLITALAKLPGVFVVARNSTSGFADRPAAVKQVGRELGVGYVLAGSVRREGERVRINVQLIDAATGHHLWAERYDGTVADTFTLQDAVVSNTASAVAGELKEVWQTEGGRLAGSTLPSQVVQANRPPTAVAFENAITSLDVKTPTASRTR